MIRTYSDKQRLLTSHCDMLGAWKPSAILETMQDVIALFVNENLSDSAA